MEGECEEVEVSNTNKEASIGEESPLNMKSPTRNGWTQLSFASFKGHIDDCEKLLQAGAAVDPLDKEGRSPLSLASYWGHAKVCEVLLQEKANVNHATR